MQICRAALPIEAPTPLSEHRYGVVASTSARADDGITIPAEAWDFERFRRNPVLTWYHPGQNSLPPIGRVPSIARAGDRVEAEMEFATGVWEFAGLVEDLWAGGYIRAVSTGGNLFGLSQRDDGEIVPERAELTHLAVAPVGLDAGALALSRALNTPIDTLRVLFDPHAGEPAPEPADATPTLTPADLPRLDAASAQIRVLRRRT